MTQTASEDVVVDANLVIDELVAQIGRQAKEIAILRAQLKTQTSHKVSATPPE